MFKMKSNTSQIANWCLCCRLPCLVALGTFRAQRSSQLQSISPCTSKAVLGVFGQCTSKVVQGVFGQCTSKVVQGVFGQCNAQAAKLLLGIMFKIHRNVTMDEGW